MLERIHVGCLLCNGGSSLCASVRSSSWLQTPFLFLSPQSIRVLSRYLTLFVCFFNPRQTQPVQRLIQKNTKTLAPRRPHFLCSCSGAVPRANHSARVTSRVRLQTGARSCGRTAERGGVHHNGPTCGGLAGLGSGIVRIHGVLDDDGEDGVGGMGCKKGVCVCMCKSLEYHSFQRYQHSVSQSPSQNLNTIPLPSPITPALTPPIMNSSPSLSTPLPYSPPKYGTSLHRLLSHLFLASLFSLAPLAGSISTRTSSSTHPLHAGGTAVVVGTAGVGTDGVAAATAAPAVVFTAGRHALPAVHAAAFAALHVHSWYDAGANR
jgi:hypothetical protein